MKTVAVVTGLLGGGVTIRPVVQMCTCKTQKAKADISVTDDNPPSLAVKVEFHSVGNNKNLTHTHMQVTTSRHVRARWLL